MALSIPLSTYNRFTYNKDLGTRYGQQFYEFMELHKVTGSFDKVWCDKLYEQNPPMARQMILTVLDHNN